MESLFMHVVHAAIWAVVVGIGLAAYGAYALVRDVIHTISRTERQIATEVHGGIESVKHAVGRE